MQHNAFPVNQRSHVHGRTLSYQGFFNDLRGLLAALHLMEKGICAGQALRLGVINKAFEPFEQQLAADTVWARIPEKADRAQLFGD